jgi:adhesin transport system outer membrane protein
MSLGKRMALNKRSNTNGGLFTLVFAVALGVTSASGAPLREELTDLLGAHPLIRSGQAQVQSADQGVRTSLSPFLPNLSLRGEIGREKVYTPGFRATPNGKFDAKPEETTATLTQNLWDGGAKYANRRGAKLQLEVADYSLTNVRQSVILEGTTGYLNVLRQSSLLAIAEQNERSIREQLNLEDERVQRGAGIAVDVLQAKSRLQFALEQRATVRGALEDARSRYLQVFGRVPLPTEMAIPRRRADIPDDLETAVSIGVTSNPQVRVAQRQIDIVATQRAAIKSEYQPRIDLVLEGSYEKDFNGVPDIRRDYSGRLRGTWTLFNGFSTQSRARQATYDSQARMEELAQIRRKTEESIRLAWYALMTAQERTELLENAVNIASEVYDSRRKLREAGRETIINVLDAESEVLAAQINYTSAQFDALIARYQLLRAMGQLEIDIIDPGR